MHVSLARATAAVLLIAAAPLASAQSSTAAAEKKPAASGASKPAAKADAKPSGGKPALARSAQKAVEEVTPIDDDPAIKISDADLEMAKQVHVGEMPCELGASVRVRAARRDGLFVISTKGYRFLMHPVESRTGAIRLEDPRRGAMWLQLGNKSMLMSQKLGQRLADECQSPQQLTVADDLKRNPRPSILEPMSHHGQGGMHGGMHGGGGGMQGGMHGGGMRGGMPGGTPPAAIPVPGASAPAAAAAAQHSASQPHAHPAPADAAPVPAPAVPGSGSPPAR